MKQTKILTNIVARIKFLVVVKLSGVQIEIARSNLQINHKITFRLVTIN